MHHGIMHVCAQASRSESLNGANQPKRPECANLQARRSAPVLGVNRGQAFFWAFIGLNAYFTECLGHPELP
jgi:hypothetical protein